MSKKMIEICEICGNKDCSGKIYWAYKELKNKILWVCEGQTKLVIYPKLFYMAGQLYKKDFSNSEYAGIRNNPPSKYIVAAAKNLGYKDIPVVRIFRDKNMVFPVLPKVWGDEYTQIGWMFERLCIPFKQLRGKYIFNNEKKRVEEVGID